MKQNQSRLYLPRPRPQHLRLCRLALLAVIDVAAPAAGGIGRGGRRRTGAGGRGRGGGCTTLAADDAADAVAAVSVCRSVDGTGIGGVGVSCGAGSVPAIAVVGAAARPA